MSRLSSRLSARRAFVAAALAVVVGGFAAPALATDMNDAEPVVNLTGDGGDLQAMGASVTVAGTVAEAKAAGAVVNVHVTATGNLWLAGAQVTFDGTVGRGLHVAGADIDIRGNVIGNADIAAAVVKSDIVVGGRLRVGGANVALGPDTDIKGALQGGGAVFAIAGHIGGPVQVGGGVVTFDGRADASVEIAANTVIIGPDARITGNLIVRSPNATQIDPAAVVSGTTSHIAPPSVVPVAPWLWSIIFAAAIALGTILAGIVLMLFGGRVFATATEHVRHRPLSSFLFGILTLVLIPFISLVLCVTIVGLSVGVAVLLLLPVLIVFGHAVAVAGIAGGVLIRRQGELGVLLGLLMLIVGAIVLVLIGLIPWVGPALIAVAIVLGTGAFTRTLGHRIRRTDPRPTVVA